MRLSTATLFPTSLVLLQYFETIFAQTTSALTLSTFQPINGFSNACTKAYNTPLTDCSNADFSGQGCSAKCIGFLDNLTNLLTTTCVGTSAYPNTLIGIFLAGNGTRTLCSNAEGSSSSSNNGNGYGQGGGQSGVPVQSTGIEVSASTTSTSTSSSSTSSSTPQAAATSSTTTIVATTIGPESTTTSIAVVGITVAPESTLDASTSTSHSKSPTSSSSTSTSTGNGNGGGTPLDIESSACREAKVRVWVFALFVGLASVTCLL